jgi:hypothetical protein
MPRAALLFAFLSVPTSFAQWAPAPPLKTARQWHTATLLQDGSVLVAGGKGINAVFPPNAEIYDAAMLPPAIGNPAAPSTFLAFSIPPLS